MTLTIVHVNDVHGCYEVYARAAALARSRKAILLDAGDAFEATSLRCAATRGGAAARLWRTANVTAITVGNAEILHYGAANLQRIARISRKPLLTANLMLSNGEQIPGTRPWIMVEHCGQRVAILGVTVPLHSVYDRFGIRALDPFSVTAESLPHLQSEADLIVVQSHLGLWDDEKLAKIPGIDLIVGAHSHDRLEEPRWVGKVPIVQASMQGRWIGEVTIDRGQVSAHLHAAADVAPAPDVLAELSRVEADVEDWSLTPVAKLSRPFSRVQLGQTVVDLLADVTGADCAILTEGLVTKGLPKGVIDRGMLHEAFPLALKPTIADLTGNDLLELLERAHHPSQQRRRLTVLRGRRMGGIFKSGIEIRLDAAGRQSRIRSAAVRGEPLRLRNSYRVACTDIGVAPLAKLVPVSAPAKINTDTLLFDVLERSL
jgi:5'-nucleotidase